MTIAPYPDRPTEGVLQINSSMSAGSALDAATSTSTGGIGSGAAAGSWGYGIQPCSSVELTRHLERILKDGDNTIDLEVNMYCAVYVSICVVSVLTVIYCHIIESLKFECDFRKFSAIL
jgi:hypothetical protein